MKAFRISTIRLDDDHEVSGITVVLDAPYLGALREAIGLADGDTLEVLAERGGTELHIDLDVVQLLALFRTAGGWTAATRRIPYAFEVLTLVVYRLMGDF